MTDNEIKKALECCSQSGDFTKTQVEVCSLCPYDSWGDCTGQLKADLFDLINRQKAEIENLTLDLNQCKVRITCYKAEIERLKKAIDNYESCLKSVEKIKAEAYKEFAERLKKEECYQNGWGELVIYEEELDNLLKELEGENDEG